MNEKFLKPYDPKETEGRIYENWDKSGYFDPDKLPARHKEPFTIIMPPPNANGSLHAGHAVFVTLEDLIIRYRRMTGRKALWVPGADHAGFETQVVYEKKLEKEGRSRFQMEPDALRKEIMDFTLVNKSFMEGQLRSLGASCDWSREKFTLDPDIQRVVYSTFEELWKDKLLYRGARPVNWCTKHQTSLSELETKDKEQTDTMYYIKYGPFTVATVRPETIFGDVAVAVHPEDDRYKDYIGQEISIKTPIGDIVVKVIGDEMVEREFGTGALKITPAHDKNDFAAGARHKLPIIEVIDRYGKMNEKAGKYAGMKIDDARKAVVADMQEMGLLEKTEPYKHVIPVCYKCERTIEPRVLSQWFVKMKPLAEKAIQSIEKNEVVFYPDSHRKIILHWLNNIEDWNISRQIVWGIPIPAKICPDCNEAVVDVVDKVKKCKKCGGEMEKDPDTFDTWFSSGQWPYAVLGFPNKRDYKTFYPTQVMETAGDIIFFWVSRMLMFGLYRTEQVPFDTVYLHGLVTAKDGQKMSKSKGNVLSPIDLSEKYGTDALRMALIIGNTPGTSTALYEDKIKAYKHFANKIWNVSRFVLSNTEDMDPHNAPELVDEDKSTLRELDALLEEVTTDLEKYRFYLAGEKLYHYFWHTFADVLVEASKARLSGERGDAKSRKSAQWMLWTNLRVMLKALHPFMPFITEEIWGLLPGKNKKMLIIETWPHNIGT